MKAATQKIDIPDTSYSLYLRREDLLHPQISGNKLRKLKYNFEEATSNRHSTILTFGGAHSNHISAVAYYGKMAGLKTIGVIRGEEINELNFSATLRQASSQGMQLIFISRSDYRLKESQDFLNQLKAVYGSYYLIPEGGTNALAVRGCEQIIGEGDDEFNYICSAVGTGGTLSGLINASSGNQKVIGFSALNEDFLEKSISRFVCSSNWRIERRFHFGGYAKIDSRLVDFMNDFSSRYCVLLDPVYTGKMMFGIFRMIENREFEEGCKILAIHTGGIQGIEAMNNTLQKRQLPLLKYI